MSGIILVSVGNSYGAIPINTDVPAISGTVAIGNSLSCSTGTWSGAPAPTFTYQWQRGTTNISGATSASYTIVSADGASTLRCIVTATNTLGVVSANSANTIAVPIVRAMSSETTVTGYKTRNLQLVYDTANDKVVATYLDGNNSQYPTSKVGTVSSGSISWGTPVVIQSGGSSYGIAEGRKGTVYNSTSGKVVAVIANGGTNIASYVGTVTSGNSISWGSVSTARSSAPAWTDNQATVVSTTDSSKVVFYYMDPSNYNIKAKVGTISGTSISWGSESTAHANTTADSLYPAAIYDSSQSKTVISYYDRGSYNGYGRVRVGTISGTTISHGTSRSTPLPQWSRPEGMAYSESSGKLLLAGSYGKCAIGDVSGTSVSFGSSQSFNTSGYGGSGDVRATYNSATEDFIIAFKDVADSYDGKVVDVSVSGTTCSFTSILDFYGDANDDMKYHQIMFDDDTRQAILSLEDEKATPSYEGFTVVYTPAYP